VPAAETKSETTTDAHSTTRAATQRARGNMRALDPGGLIRVRTPADPLPSVPYFHFDGSEQQLGLLPAEVVQLTDGLPPIPQLRDHPLQGGIAQDPGDV
jgi:hypothetical protein